MHRSTNCSKMCVCCCNTAVKVADWCEVCLLEANIKPRCDSGVCHSTRTKLWTLHHLLSKPSTAASPSVSGSTGSITRGWMVTAQEQDKAKDSFTCSNVDAFLCQFPPRCCRNQSNLSKKVLSGWTTASRQLAASGKTNPVLGGSQVGIPAGSQVR